MSGEVLGNRYELIEKIGEGGMAIVYKARDNKLHRLVAVKILKKEFADNKEISDKFKKEATAIANFSDANIVNVLDVGHEDEGNVDYFVMEYVHGKTLKEVIVYNGKLSYVTAINIAIQIAKALECAHKNNIIHRDVKPQNILLNENGEVKVTDFGIAKSSTSSTITNTTTIMGSAHYLSPEQAKGSFIDARSDIYSLGIVLYEMVTGRLPFEGESPVTIALKHIQEEPVEPKKYNNEIPDSLNNLIMKSISKETINRYQNCRELINDLQKIKDNPDIVISDKNIVDDGRTIVMEPIRIDEIPKVAAKKVYTKADFNSDFDDEEYDDYDDEDDSFKKEKVSSSSKYIKRKSKKTLIIGIIIAVLLIGGFAFGASMLNVSGTQEIKAPNLLGVKVDVAKTQLEAQGLKLEVLETVNSDKEENTILEMSPKAGEVVEKGATIKVKVSGGIEKVKVPDLRDYDINYITNILDQKGLKYQINKEYNDIVESGYLISQSPERDTEVAKGSVVTLTISNGPEVKLVMVENCVGYTLDKAKSTLEGLGLVVNTKEVETDRSSENGIVLEQSLQGTRVEQGTTVTISVGKYVETTINVGSYIVNGMYLNEAVLALNGANIPYTIIGGTPDTKDYSSYTIKSFTPVTIKPGETVKLQIEKVTQTPVTPPADNNTGDNNEETGSNGDDNTGNNGNNTGNTDGSNNSNIDVQVDGNAYN